MQILNALKKLKYVSAANPLPTVHSARSAVAVTPDNAVDLAEGVTKYVYVGVAGDVKATMEDDTVVVFKALPVGLHPLVVKRIWATGTAATNLLALR